MFPTVCQELPKDKATRLLGVRDVMKRMKPLKKGSKDEKSF